MGKVHAHCYSQTVMTGRSPCPRNRWCPDTASSIRQSHRMDSGGWPLARDMVLLGCHDLPACGDEYALAGQMRRPNRSERVVSNNRVGLPVLEDCLGANPFAQVWRLDSLLATPRGDLRLPFRYLGLVTAGNPPRQLAAGQGTNKREDEDIPARGMGQISTPRQWLVPAKPAFEFVETAHSPTQ